MKKIISICLLVVLLGSCTSNNNKSVHETEKTSTTSVLSGNEAVDYGDKFDDSNSDYSAIKKGIWWAVNSDYTIKDRYYYFDGKGAGSYLSQVDGKGDTFTYDISDDKLDISIGSDNAYILSLSNGDNGNLKLTDGNHYDMLTYQGDIDFSQFKFYNNEELIEMGKKYFLKSHEKLTPYIDAEIWQDGSIALHFYYIGESNTATIEWYIVDRFTAKGKDLFENDIDLTEVL